MLFRSPRTLATRCARRRATDANAGEPYGQHWQPDNYSGASEGFWLSLHRGLRRLRRASDKHRVIPATAEKSHAPTARREVADPEIGSGAAAAVFGFRFSVVRFRFARLGPLATIGP